MTLSHVDSATKLIVMPETVLDPINMDDIYGDNPGLALIRKSLEKAPMLLYLLEGWLSCL
jgi:hypothetical protein